MTDYKHVAMAETQYKALKKAMHRLELSGINMLLQMVLDGDKKATATLNKFWPGPEHGVSRSRRFKMSPDIAEQLHKRVPAQKKCGPKPTILGLSVLLGCIEAE